MTSKLTASRISSVVAPKSCPKGALSANASSKRLPKGKVVDERVEYGVDSLKEGCSKTVPQFVLPQSIVQNKSAFFDIVFDWFSKKHAPSSQTNNTPLLTIPWRAPPYNKDPYAIWVSEVMSQQTQLGTVVRYWTSWMQTFPTVEALAAADGEAVRAVWAGMGFYRRADLLHKGAKYIVNEYRVKVRASPPKITAGSSQEAAMLFPQSYHEWVKEVPGVGPYTAAAITSICFDAPATAVDGNVLRVMSRLCGTRGVDPKNARHLAALQGALNAGLLPTTGRQRRTAPEDSSGSAPLVSACGELFPFLSDCLPDRRGRVNEGLMEIGASICGPNIAPQCHLCPFSCIPPTVSNASSVPYCTASDLLRKQAIDAIDGVIPLRGTAIAVREEAIDTFVIFVGDFKSKDEVKSERDNEKALSDEESRRLAQFRLIAEGFSVVCVSRPSGGLLSEMTDFPYRETEQAGRALKMGSKKETESHCATLGSFVHVFSHIKMTVNVHAICVCDRSTAMQTALAAVGGGRENKISGSLRIVQLRELPTQPVSQLAVKSLQTALPHLFTLNSKGKPTEAEAKALAHAMCNRHIAGQKRPR